MAHLCALWELRPHLIVFVQMMSRCQQHTVLHIHTMVLLLPSDRTVWTLPVAFFPAFLGQCMWVREGNDRIERMTRIYLIAENLWLVATQIFFYFHP